MQIAPVSVVFALAAAGALGMAVQDTITGPKVSLSIEDEVASLDQLAAEQQYQREELERITAETAESEGRYQERRNLIGTLFGTPVASRGPGFGVLEVSMSIERFNASYDDATEAMAPAQVRVDAEYGARVTRLMATTTDQPTEMCELAVYILTSRWGAPVGYEDGEQLVWWNAATGDRVRVDSRSSCDLVLDRAVATGPWIEQALRLGRLKTEKDVARAIAEPAADAQDKNDYSQWWELPGLAAGEGPTSVYVEYADAKVKTVVVSTKSTDRAAVIEQLREALGEPTQTDDETLDWEAKRIRLFTPTTSELVELSFGEVN